MTAARLRSRTRRHFEEDGPQRWDTQREVEGPPGVFAGDGPRAAVIPEVRPAVDFGVRVEDLAVEAPGGCTDPIVLAGDGGEVADHDDRVVWVLRAPQERDDAVLPVMQL